MSGFFYNDANDDIINFFLKYPAMQKQQQNK